MRIVEGRDKTTGTYDSINRNISKWTKQRYPSEQYSDDAHKSGTREKTRVTSNSITTEVVT